VSDFERRYGASTTAPRAVRRDVAAYLEGNERQDVHVVVLLVGELVTNSVVHAGGIITVRASQLNGVLRIEVSDASDSLPVVRAPDMGGRGLRLVEALAESWGSERLAGGGKTVWVEVANAP
jgi:anti-sigma regulatory factor (Ser/Thr protein kinase)